MNWLKKLFSGSARRAVNPAPSAPESTVVQTAEEARVVAGESVASYVTRLEKEAERTGNLRMANRARALRAIHGL